MPRVRLTKAEKEFRQKKADYVAAIRTFALTATDIQLTFPAVKGQARAAQAAMVDLSEALQGVVVEKTP